MPVSLSATGAEIAPSLSEDADFNPDTHHDWLALARQADAEGYVRGGQRWPTWRALVPYRCKSEVVIVQTSVDTATLFLPMQGNAALPVGLQSTPNDLTSLMLLLEVEVRKTVPWARVSRVPKLARAGLVLREGHGVGLTHHSMWILRVVAGAGQARRCMTARVSSCKSQLDYSAVHGARDAAWIHRNADRAPCTSE